MKLAAIVLASLLALPSLARADDVDGAPRVEQRHKNKQLKRALMAHFDENGDGKLGPRERVRAARVLAKIQRKLAGQHGQQGRQRPMRQKFIQRFDTNRDGHVDENEMPPGAARKLKRFDQDQDGWVEPGEMR